MSEFGRDCDDWNDWFGCDNSNPLFHFPARRPLPPPQPVTCPPAGQGPARDAGQPQGLRPQHAAEALPHLRAFRPLHQRLLRRWSTATACCFPRPEDLAPCTPSPASRSTTSSTTNCVRAAGVTFTAARPDEEKESEFLASEDQWFRPVMVRTGPDGALWVVDMYRYVIEHPDWLPPQGKSDLASYWRLGEDKGRIYRVVPQGRGRPEPRHRLDRDSTTALLERIGRQQRLAARHRPATARLETGPVCRP